MVLIKSKAEAGRDDGGYSRLFGDQDLGLLLSQVHGTVNNAGNELERVIEERLEPIGDLDTCLEQETVPEGVYLVPKAQVKACKRLGGRGKEEKKKGKKNKRTEPDFVIFKTHDKVTRCYLVELKDGDAFDTKKAKGEYNALKKFRQQIPDDFPFEVSIHFCSFNQSDRTKIVKGFKREIDESEALTGREFCELLGLDYDKIVKDREADQLPNLRYFVKRLKEIEAVREEWER